MEKRIFLAVVISLAFLWTWAAIAPKLFPELVRKPAPAETKPAPATKPAATASTPAAAAPAPAAAQPATTPAPAPAPGVQPAAAVPTVAATAVDVRTVRTDDYVARFSNRGAQLVSFQLLGYQGKDKNPVELVRVRDARSTNYPFFIESENANVNRTLNNALWQVTERKVNGETVLEFRYAGNGITATKRFTLGDEYLFDVFSSINPPVKYRMSIGPGIRTLAPEEQDSQFIITGNAVLQQDDELEVFARDDGDRFQTYNGVQFLGIEDNYFLTALRPQRDNGGVFRRIELPMAGKKEKRQDYFAGLNAASDGTLQAEAFFGPKQTNILERYGLERVLQFGMFGFIARLLLEALLWINQFTHNYGWAIVVLTIIIKIILYPLQHKSIVAMKKMQRLQPKMEVIKNRYKKAKTDPEQRNKMNMEMMKLYQQEGINPMSGCFPILLQMPILFGFYGLLSRAIELRGANWILWIQDLSEKDPYYITPILMTATMFIQTYITPSTGDPAQRRIFLIMPLIFGFFFKDFPSGLVLYWLVQNVLTIVQQMIMNKYWKDHPAELQTA